MATTSWPGRTTCESPSSTGRRFCAPVRTTARSVSGSSPTSSASHARPSFKVTSRREAPWTTWLFVRTKPSGVKTKPEPPPPEPRRPRASPPRRERTSMLTTEGLTRSAAPTTAREYASNSSSSSRRPPAGSRSPPGAGPPPEIKRNSCRTTSPPSSRPDSERRAFVPAPVTNGPKILAPRRPGDFNSCPPPPRAARPEGLQDGLDRLPLERPVHGRVHLGEDVGQHLLYPAADGAAPVRPPAVQREDDARLDGAVDLAQGDLARRAGEARAARRARLRGDQAGACQRAEDAADDHGVRVHADSDLLGLERLAARPRQQRQHLHRHRESAARRHPPPRPEPRFNL